MATVVKKRRLVNPGTPRKGSAEAKRKMARLRAMRQTNAGSNSKRKAKKAWSHTGPMVRSRSMALYEAKTAKEASIRTKAKRRAKKTQNVGELITIGMVNPGERRGSESIMRRRRKTVRRRRNPGVALANPRRRRAVRRSNPRYRRIMRRRNPDAKGLMYQVGGVIGGATLTGILVGVIPPQYTAGPMGYLVTGIVAYAQGTLAGKALKNPSLGDSMVVGGMTVLVLKVLGEFLPNLAVGLAPKGLGWSYVDAPMTVAPMGNRFLSYPPSGGNLPMAVSNGSGVSGVRKGWR